MGQIEGNQGKQKEKVSVNYFDFKYIIGRGGFGKVWKVICKKNMKEYAMKVMSKVKIIDRKSQRSILSERNLLSKLHNPFLVNMVYAFQDSDQLYLVMDLLTGGDLRFHISRAKFFTQDQTKFFLACLILGLEYIHENLVIHRDIKPENLVCDEKGYIRITDFGVAKKFHKENAAETSGTPGYMAPEVLQAQNHSYTVDYFALGVIGYEFMLGKRPYHGRGRKEVKQDVISRQAQVKQKDIPDNWSVEAVNLINNLILRKPSQRLGFNGIAEIKSHPWFKDIDWIKLAKKKIYSPFIPRKADNYDKVYCEGEDKIGNETQERYLRIRKEESYDVCFRKYTCNNLSHEELISLANNTNNQNPNTPTVNNTINIYASANSTISSMKRTNSKASSRELQQLSIGKKLILKQSESTSYMAKSPLHQYSTNFSNPFNLNIGNTYLSRLKLSVLTPSALSNNTSQIGFNIGLSEQRNLPIISSNKRQMKKSTSLSSIYGINKNATLRPQTKIGKDHTIQYMLNSPMNIRQFNYPNSNNNSLMASTLGMSQLKRNNSTLIMNQSSKFNHHNL